MKQYDLTVAYRVYPKVSKICGLFELDDKFNLFKLCLKSFQIATKPLNVKIIAILDSCPPKYRELFQEYFDAEDLVFEEIDQGGNEKTFRMQLELLQSQEYSELVYLAEDDYFYLPDAFTNMLNVAKNPSVDFATPYDQLDYHYIYLHQHKHQYINEGDIRWRDVAATTLTFLTKKTILNEKDAMQNLLQFFNGHKDTIIWLRMTKFKIKNPLILIVFIILAIRSRIANSLGITKNSQLSRPGIKHMFETYFQKGGWRFVYSTRKYKLYAPEPSLATHMAYKFLAKDIDWKSKFNELGATLEIPEVPVREGYHGFLKK